VADNVTLNNFTAAAYFDFYFGRLTATYITNLGNPISDPPFVSGSLWQAQLYFTLIAKLPIVIKSLTLWSGLGVGYLTTLMLDLNGDGVNDKNPNASTDDIFAVFALGGDFKIAHLLTIGPSFTVNYDLTPTLYPNEAPGSSHTLIFFQFSLSVGLVF
jgi:hypothetical protein